MDKLKKVGRILLIAFGCVISFGLPWVIIALGLVFLIPALLVRVGVADHSFTTWRRARADKPTGDVAVVAKQDMVMGAWWVGFATFALLVIIPDVEADKAAEEAVKAEARARAEAEEEAVAAAKDAAAREAQARAAKAEAEAAKAKQALQAEKDRQAADAEAQRLAKLEDKLKARVEDIKKAATLARGQIKDGDLDDAAQTVAEELKVLKGYEGVDWPPDATQAKRDLDAVLTEIDSARKDALRQEAVDGVKDMRKAEKAARALLGKRDYDGAEAAIAAAMDTLDRFESIELPDEVAKARDDLKELAEEVDERRPKKVDPGNLVKYQVLLRAADDNTGDPREYMRLLEEIHEKYPNLTYERISDYVFKARQLCAQQGTSSTCLDFLKAVKMSMNGKGIEGMTLDKVLTGLVLVGCGNK